MEKQNQVEVPISIAGTCNFLAQKILDISAKYDMVVNVVKERDTIIEKLKKEIAELKTANEETQEIEVSEE